MPADTTTLEPTMCAASDTQAREALQQAREVFGRTLSCWACDLLRLQRRGRHLTTWRSSPAQLRKAA